jgi:hypothetical protein
MTVRQSGLELEQISNPFPPHANAWALYSAGSIGSNQNQSVMKRQNQKLLLAAIATTIAVSSPAADIVRDTWIDGTRADPASPVYSENGTDGDLDGDVESAWYHAGSGGTSSTVINGNPGITPGILRSTVGAGSTSLTTYFTPEASPVTLLNAGDQFKITWAFTPSGVVSTNPAPGQSFRIAIADSPLANRLLADGAPGNGIYPGYALFASMSTTVNHANPFNLMERNIGAGSTAFLSASGSWTSLDDEEVAGTTGYTDGTLYTFTFSATLNGLGGLDIYSSMAGGALGGDGLHEVTFTDATPNSLTFDSFAVRPSSLGTTATQFDTSLFKVELTQVPEPTVTALMGIGLMGLIAARRNRR